MERILGHKIRDRNIKLYTPEWYLPNWAKHFFGNIEYNRHTKDSVLFNYTWELRDYQVEWLYHIIENKGWLIEASTWSGKWHIIMAITQFFKKKTLIVTPTKKLVKELVDKFKEFTNYVPGTYYSDWKNIKDITITTHTSFVQDTLWKNELWKFDVILVDECDDKLSLKMVQSLCYSDCNILVWLSWTTNRQELNQQDLELIFWPHIMIWEYQMMPSEVTHHIYQRQHDEVSMIDFTNWHYQRKSMLDNIQRFKTVVQTIKEIRQNTFLSLLLLDRIEEIEKYSQEFPEAIVITGQTKVKDDEIWIIRLEKTGGLIIGSIKKMYRWIDIPILDCVIVCSPVRYDNTIIQCVWRALRKHPKKEKVEIHLINDDVLKNQRYEQTKAIKNEYWIQPKILYINKTLWTNNSA